MNLIDDDDDDDDTHDYDGDDDANACYRDDCGINVSDMMIMMAKRLLMVTNSIMVFTNDRWMGR